MRLLVPIIALALGACSGEANHIGNPLVLPVTGLTTLIDNSIYAGERAPVESYVSVNYDDLVSDIEAGGGDALTEAFDLAGVPNGERDAFLDAMEGYDLSAPDNLVVALMVWRD